MIQELSRHRARTNARNISALLLDIFGNGFGVKGNSRVKISEQKYQEELELFFKRVKLNVAEDLIKEGAASKLELLRLKQDSAIEKYDKSQREMSYKMFIPFYDDEKK